jgi:hypothetical protein
VVGDCKGYLGMKSKPKEPEDLEGLKITGAEIGEMVKFD